MWGKVNWKQALQLRTLYFLTADVPSNDSRSLPQLPGVEEWVPSRIDEQKSKDDKICIASTVPSDVVCLLDDEVRDVDSLQNDEVSDVMSDQEVVFAASTKATKTRQAGGIL